MSGESNLILLERFLIEGLGKNSLRRVVEIESKMGNKFLFYKSQTCASESKHRFNVYRNEILDDFLDSLDRRKDKLVVRISMVEFAKLSKLCPKIATEMNGRTFSLMIVVDDFSTLNLEIGINPFKSWSRVFGLSFSQHPNYPYIFLIDCDYRFHEISGKLSRYEEIKKTFQIVDKNHCDVLFFVMGDDLVKRLEVSDIYLSESIKDLRNFIEVQSSSVAVTLGNSGIICDETGIFIRRPYISGMTLTSFLECNSPKKAVELLLLACSNLSKKRVFPNDLRPWNLVFQKSGCILIDFPKNINCDDDTNGIPNFISLLLILEYIKVSESVSFETVTSKFLNSICQHAEIYNSDSFQKLEFAWLNLEKYINSIKLFSEGKLPVEVLLDEVFNE